MNLSVTILTKDSARLLPRVLEALHAFSDIVVLDSGSTDNTLAVARQFPNTRVFTTEFKGFGPLHNEASSLAQNDWILSLDSDEVLSEELALELKNLRLDESCVYSVSMRNYFNGKWIRGCGWERDNHVRLFNRKRTRFTDSLVHEYIITEGFNVVPLSSPVLHFSYTCVADFLTKTQRYSELFAQQNQGKTRSSPAKAIRHGLAAFAKTYFVQRGFLWGPEGLVISVTSGFCGFYKYMKLWEANLAIARGTEQPKQREENRLSSPR